MWLSNGYVVYKYYVTSINCTGRVFDIISASEIDIADDALDVNW